MHIICAKCHHERQPNATAPDWQCPTCGVYYAKVDEASRNASQVQSTPLANAPASQTSGIPWAKLMLIAALIWGGSTGMKVAKNKHIALSSIGANADRGRSMDDLAALAATVKPADVVMYSTTECQYCIQAKGWLKQGRKAQSVGSQ